MASGQITHTQGLIESMLLAEPYFSNITIVRIDKGDIQNIVDTAIAKIGICVLIMTPSLIVEFKDTPGPFFKILWSCEVVENVVINRGTGGTGKAGSEVAEYVAATLHQSPAPGDNVLTVSAVHLTGIGVDENKKVVITYACDGEGRGGVALDVNPTATPAISGTSTITVTCATAGASIFYTPDGRNPGPQTGTLYTAPFAVVSGTKVRVRAWIWGYTVSAEASYTRP